MLNEEKIKPYNCTVTPFQEVNAKIVIKLLVAGHNSQVLDISGSSRTTMSPTMPIMMSSWHYHILTHLYFQSSLTECRNWAAYSISVSLSSLVVWQFHYCVSITSLLSPTPVLSLMLRKGQVFQFISSPAFSLYPHCHPFPLLFERKRRDAFIQSGQELTGLDWTFGWGDGRKRFFSKACLKKEDSEIREGIKYVILHLCIAWFMKWGSFMQCISFWNFHWKFALIKIAIFEFLKFLKF